MAASTPAGTLDRSIPGTWHGAPSVLPVIDEHGARVEVRLAQRPDGSTAWIPMRAATFTSTPYRIVVNLSQRHLTLFDANAAVLSAPVGIGLARTPTPTGQYFVAFFARPPSSGYGPFVMVTSAHSTTISDFEESGDAMVAIHGPLGAGRIIGTRGAPVSNGCIRMHLRAQRRLGIVPAGSPVVIVSG
jgi:lipoprotein-anchoring transpeptidase ErfK/SrfK